RIQSNSRSKRSKQAGLHHRLARRPGLSATQHPFRRARVSVDVARELGGAGRTDRGGAVELGEVSVSESLQVNIWDDDWGVQEEEWSGGGARSKRLVGRGPLLGASLYELERGKFAVYHVHHGSEELLIVLRGRPTLRTPAGERQLEEGEVVHFPAGPDGAH